jgi:hypothetical protein
MAKGRPTLANLVLVAGMIALAVPGSRHVRRRVPDHGRRLRQGWGLRGRGLRSRSCSAAMYICA